MNNKTLSKIVASALPAICLSTQITSDCHAGELLRSIQYEQSKLPQVAQNQVMQNVFKNYDTLNHELKDTLTTIWYNDAGNLLLRRLHKNIKDETQRITILWNARDRDGETNLIRYDNFTVYLTKNEFGNCIGYCNSKFTKLPNTLDAVLFHELTHGLHKLMGLNNVNKQRSIHFLHKIQIRDIAYKQLLELWSNDEEVHTITGRYLGKDGRLHFDCLNTNSYLVLNAIKLGTIAGKITQRIFHLEYKKGTDIFKPCKQNVKNIVIRSEKYLDIIC